MKTGIRILVIACCVTAFISCKKKSDDTTPVTPAAASFTCKIGGTAWAADSAVYINNGSQTFIMAYKAGRMQFEINLSGITAATYSIGSSNDFIYWPETTSFSGAGSGSVTISAYDNTANQVTGTFGPFNTSGPGGTFNITDGVFTKLPRRY